MEQYILAHDVGTSGNKATLFTIDGRLAYSISAGYEVRYSAGNCAEQDPDDWWQAVAKTTRELLEHVRPEQIMAVTFSGQMQGCVCVDKDGNPLRPSLIWADLRAEPQTRQLVKLLDSKEIFRITGQRISPAHTIQKLMWVRDNQPEIFANTYKVLQSKDYIILKLTGNFVTDFSDAAGTNCLNIKTWKWSRTMFTASGIKKDKMPDILHSTDIAGKVTKQAAAICGLLEGTPVVCGGGDGAAATVGSGCVEQGSAYVCMGTSAWIASTSDIPILEDQMRISNFVHLVPGKYIPLGNMNACGASFDWMKNQLAQPELMLAKVRNNNPYELINHATALTQPGSDGLLYLPYLAGERSPYWNPDARGAFIGLKNSHKRQDMYRAVLEGVALHLELILQIHEETTQIDKLSVIGGGATNALWVQILADVMNKPLQTLNYIDEATSVGAAVTGGIGIGAFKDFSVVNEFVKPIQQYEPVQRNVELYENYKPIFEQAYLDLVGTYERLAKL